MALNRVIWGARKDYHFEGTRIYKYSHAAGHELSIEFTDKTVKAYEIITADEYSENTYSVTRGLVGSALLGPVGAGMGSRTKHYSEYQILIVWHDDQRSILEIDGKWYNQFILQMTKYNIPDTRTYNQLQAQQPNLPTTQQSEDFDIDYFTDQENLLEVEDIFFTKSLVKKQTKVYFKLRNISPHAFDHIKIEISLIPPKSLRNSIKDYVAEFENKTIAVMYRTVFTLEIPDLKPEDMKDKQIKVSVIEIDHELLHSYQVKNTEQNTKCQINGGWYDLEFILAMPDTAETQKTQKLQRLTGLTFSQCREIVEEITCNGFIPPRIEV